MAAVSSNSTESSIVEKSLLLSTLNSGPKAIEDSTSLMEKIASVENVNKKNDSRTHSPALMTEIATSGLQHRNDDELTSLTWLQDSNLLFGTALLQMRVVNSEKHVLPVVNGVKSVPVKMEEVKTKPVEAVTSPEIESPASELSEEQELRDSNEREEEIVESIQSNSQDQFSVPYNPQIHVKSKPPYSFSSLIFMAIEDSTEKALPVKDIYSWVIRHFPYYRGAPTGWKNSVRHNLSLNKCFRKVDKSPTLGKGSLWMVDPAYRPNLLQTLNKTPYPSTNRNDHMYVTNAKNAMNRNPLDHLNRLKEGAPMYPEESRDVSLQFINKKIYENGHQTSEENGRISPISLPMQSYFNMALQERPMLLKQVHKDDVDAAAAMLVLKHGPMILQDNPQFSIKNADITSVSNGFSGGRKRKQLHTELPDTSNSLTFSSPGVDHSYISPVETSNDNSGSASKRHKISPKNNCNLSSCSNNDQTKAAYPENKHVPLYEANALLKLASIAASLASTDIHLNTTSFNSSVHESEVLPSDFTKLNETRGSSHSSSTIRNTPLKTSNRKKKNLYPVKRNLNNEIKRLSNNNSRTILNKNDLGHLDYPI